MSYHVFTRRNPAAAVATKHDPVESVSYYLQNNYTTPHDLAHYIKAGFTKMHDKPTLAYLKNKRMQAVNELKRLSKLAVNLPQNELEQRLLSQKIAILQHKIQHYNDLIKIEMNVSNLSVYNVDNSMKRLKNIFLT